jgi:putative transposase
MKKVRFTEEQIVRIVQESRAESAAAVARRHGVSEQTLYNWRKRFGGMEPSQVAELKRLAQENARLKRLVADRDLEIEVMKEIAAKKW